MQRNHVEILSRKLQLLEKQDPVYHEVREWLQQQKSHLLKQNCHRHSVKTRVQYLEKRLDSVLAVDIGLAEQAVDVDLDRIMEFVLKRISGQSLESVMDLLEIHESNQLEAMDDLQQLPNRPKEIQDVIEWIQQTTGCPWRTDIKWNIISRHELFDWQGPIGEGSFGIVFRARWHTTPVAIKQSHAKIVGRKVFEGVRDEIEKWSRLHHPNVVQMLGACLHTNQPFLVMNYYRNGSLFGFVSRNQVSMKQRVKWMYDMAAGLDYIHKQSIIHGDLKADNVLVDHQYNALITDFGLSQMRSFNSSSCKNKTMTQAIRWIAPERYGRKFKMTPLYDVFAFGMTSYQALTSRVPFDEESNEEIVKEWIKQNEIPDRTDGIPDNVWELFVDTIQPSEQRPSVEQIMLRLNPILYGLDGLMLSDTVEETKIDSRIDSKMDWHSTVRDGNLRQIRDMIRSGVDINQKDTFGMTALHYAAEEGHLEIVRLLLQKGALASVSNHGETPLQLAQDNGHSEICKLLEIKSPSIQSVTAELPKLPQDLDKQLIDAVVNGNLDQVKQLIQSGANPNKRTSALMDFGKPLAGQSTALHCACTLDKAEIGIYLLDNGADLNLKNDVGETPLSISLKSCLTIAFVLIQRVTAEYGDDFRRMREEGVKKLSSSDPSELGLAFALFWRASELGYLVATNDVAYMYREGKAVEQDEKMAIKWYEEAAQKGNAEAQEGLGYMYYTGRGVQNDDRVAKEWFEKAAAQNRAGAQSWMGILCREGRGIEKDLDTALEWFEKAAGQGHVYSMAYLGLIYHYHKEDKDRARDYYETAISRGCEWIKPEYQKLIN